MHDPLVLLARHRTVAAYIEIERQLTDKPGNSSILLILDTFRDRAAESMVALTIVDPNDAEKIRTLQNDVMKYDEVFKETQKIIAKGRSDIAEIRHTERDEMIDLLMETEEGRQEAIEMGIIDDPAAARG